MPRSPPTEGFGWEYSEAGAQSRTIAQKLARWQFGVDSVASKVWVGERSSDSEVGGPADTTTLRGDQCFSIKCDGNVLPFWGAADTTLSSASSICTRRVDFPSSICIARRARALRWGDRHSSFRHGCPLMTIAVTRKQHGHGS